MGVTDQILSQSNQPVKARKRNRLANRGTAYTISTIRIGSRAERYPDCPIQFAGFRPLGGISALTKNAGSNGTIFSERRPLISCNLSDMGTNTFILSSTAKLTSCCTVNPITSNTPLRESESSLN